MNLASLSSNLSRSASRFIARHASATASATASPQSVGHNRMPRVRSLIRNARGRRRVDTGRIMGVMIHLPNHDAVYFRISPRFLPLLAIPVLASLVWMLWGERPSPPPDAESVFVFEDIPPAPAPQARPDPSPPPPKPVSEPVPQETPPPQFGMQEEQLSDAGDLAVATGNTLMTEADSIVKSPVEALPALPPLVDQAPRILKGRPPEYPSRALERGLEATVVVLITIDTIGRVNQVDVERSGGRDFDPEVLRAVKALVFQPPVRGGQRMAARFRQPYEFKLQ